MGEASPTDAELVALAHAGDVEAFGRLVERNQHYIHNAVYHLVGDERDAEDIAQDVFLAAWQAAPSFEPRAAVRTWLLRITTNKCLNHKRAKRRRPTVPLVEEPHSRRPEEPSGPEADAQRSDLSAHLQAAIADLVPNQRAAVLLRHAHDLSYAEVAGVLQTSIPVVKSLLFRAHSRLRQVIDPEKI